VADALFCPPTGFERTGGQPVHVQIERWFMAAIDRGELVVGDRLPREQDLAAAFGVSRMTLRQALGALATRGLLRRSPGRFGGTSIAEPKVECDLTGLAGFTEQLRRAQLRAGACVVQAVTLPAVRAVATALELERVAEVHLVVRVRTARGVPSALERSYFPAELFRDLLERPLTESLYALLSDSYGQRPTTATEVLEPVIARDDEATLLEVPPGSPLLLITRTAYAASGRPVEYARDLFRPDRVRVSVRSGLEPADAPQRTLRPEGSSNGAATRHPVTHSPNRSTSTDVPGVATSTGRYA
jgi:GntR family transcriptional regulator